MYFNGNKVARFNLADEFDSDTESLEVHDSTVFSKFHIILVTAGIQEGTNVIAFEVHRPVGTSSSTPFVFDATGVFGVETCSTVVDSYASVTSTKVTSGSLAGIMDLNPFTVGNGGGYDGFGPVHDLHVAQQDWNVCAVDCGESGGKQVEFVQRGWWK